MWEKLFFSDTQELILRECILANKEEYSQWVLKNVILPLTIIFIPVFIFLVFKTDIIDIESLIFNGSLSLLGVNILFGMSSYLIKVQKGKPQNAANITENSRTDFDEAKLNQDILHLRERLNNYKNILVVIGATFYILPKLFHSYTSGWGLFFFALFTTLVLLASVIVGRLMFIIKDDLFEKTYYGELNKPVVEARDRWSQKYPIN